MLSQLWLSRPLGGDLSRLSAVEHGGKLANVTSLQILMASPGNAMMW